MSEKEELSVRVMTAFEVEIITRHGLAFEMIEMINFAQAIYERGLHKIIKEVFYDSVSNCCEIRFICDEEYLDAIYIQQVHDAAMKTISQFMWGDVVNHGIKRKSESEF